jgi:signal transduction histidine kinase
MRIEGSLRRRINRTFLLQAAAISIAAIISVLLAGAVIKHVLVTEALRMEAEYFWERHRGNPALPLPDTRNLQGYLVAPGHPAEVPEALRDLQPGFHEISRGANFTTVFVSQQDGSRLFLVFDGERVDELAAYFGLVPLVVVLVVLYLSVWLAFRAAQRAVSPVAWLAREVNRINPENPEERRLDLGLLPGDADEEITVLARALCALEDRLDAFVERERTFTRDASHELRTPLTVVRVATDLLLDQEDLSKTSRVTVERIRRSAGEMERLVEAFLLLARENEQGLPSDRLCLNDLVKAEVDRLELILGNKPVVLQLEARCRLIVEAPEPVVASIIGNLLRNAVSYTDTGSVKIRIDSSGLVIEDSGIGMDADAVNEAFQPYYRGDPKRRGGHGVGLTIVKRFADRFGWHVAIDSRTGVGTRVAVRFPDAQASEPDDPKA